MTHIERLVQSGHDLWRNPSLLVAFLLQYVLAILIAFLFAFVNISIVAVLNTATLASLINDPNAAPQALLNAVWNAHTLGVMIPLCIVQFVLLTAIGCWFTAGAYGMARNLLLDGSTSLRELRPSARRFFGPLLRFTLLRYLLLAIPAIPLVLSVVSIVGTTEGFVSSGQLWSFMLSGLVFLAVGTVACFLLLYGDATIVFEDASAWQAAKRTLRLFRENPGTSIAAGLLALVTIILFGLLITLCLAPLHATATHGTREWRMVDSALGFVGDIILLCVGVTIMLFIFRTYRHITGGVTRTAPYRTRKRRRA